MPVKLINHTPYSFPLEFPEGVPSPLPPGPVGTTPWMDYWYSDPVLHRFRLEVRKTGASIGVNRRPLIEIGGSAVPMRKKRTDASLGGGSEYWFFDSPVRVGGSYTYRFIYPAVPRVNPRIVTRVASTSVPLFGYVSWFLPNGHPSICENGSLVHWQWRRTCRVFFQNLAREAVVLKTSLSGRGRALFDVTVDQAGASIAHGDGAALWTLYRFENAPPDSLQRAILDVEACAVRGGRTLLAVRFLLLGDSSWSGA